MEIKVCGLSLDTNIRDIAALRPDCMGFIYYPPSPRSVCNTHGWPQKLAAQGIRPVAVTVNYDAEENLTLARNQGFKTLQLHGYEKPVTCELLRAMGLEVWKVIHVYSPTAVKDAVKYDGYADRLVFENDTEKMGGSGQKFDWNWLEEYAGETPFMLTGGIKPEDIDTIRGLKHPKLVGVDLNSGFEDRKGHKVPQRVADFINALRS